MKLKTKLIYVTVFSYALLSYLANINASETLGQSDYEMRGIFELEGECTFSLFHKPTGKTKWVRLGQYMLNAKLIDYDPDSKELTITQNNQIEILKVKESNENTISVVGSDLQKQPDSNSKNTDQNKPEKRFKIAPRMQ